MVTDSLTNRYELTVVSLIPQKAQPCRFSEQSARNFKIALRAALKVLGRRFGLRVISVRPEQESDRPKT
jgi:hypothetical protein